MTYAKIENNEIVKTGNLYDMGTRNSNPTTLSEQELKDLGVYKVEFTPLNTKSWETQGQAIYTYDSVTDKVTGTYEIITKDLEQFKAEKLTEIKNTHEQILTEGFTNSTGIKIDCEKDNQNDFLGGLILMKESGASGSTVTDYDNNTHNLNSIEYTTLCLELGNHITNLRKDKNTLRGLVNNALTHLEVSDIYWRKTNYAENSIEVINYTYNEVL